MNAIAIAAGTIHRQRADDGVGVGVWIGFCFCFCF
jgi:hypothetical protein